MFENWHHLTPDPALLSFNDKGIALLQVNEKPVCIAKYRDQFYAFSAKCPHASGRLDLGYIDALANVVCPVHHYRFNIRTGRDNLGEGYHLKTYKLELRADGLWIRL